MKMDVLFKDVKLGERFAFVIPGLSAQGVKAKFGTVKYPDDNCKGMNVIITDVLPSPVNSTGRGPGDPYVLPEDWLVTVDLLDSLKS